MRSDTIYPGKVRSIMNLLPFPSMMKIAMVDPIAFMAANGMFIMMAMRSVLMPSILRPVEIMIFGP